MVWVGCYYPDVISNYKGEMSLQKNWLVCKEDWGELKEPTNSGDCKFENLNHFSIKVWDYNTAIRQRKKNGCHTPEKIKEIEGAIHKWAKDLHLHLERIMSLKEQWVKHLAHVVD